MIAISEVMARAFMDSGNRPALTRRPDWATQLAVLMGRIGSYEVFWRNPDLRAYLEPINADFAAWCRDRDMTQQWDDEQRALAANESDDDAPYRYVRCSNCGAVNIDPIIRTSEEAPV